MLTATTRLLSLCFMALLWSCSTSVPLQPLSKRYEQLVQDSNFSVYAMQSIAAQAFEQHDLPLMAKALWKLCQRGVATSGATDDCAALLDVAIIQSDDLAQARAYLAQYFITGERHYYIQAMAVLPADDASYTSLFDTSVKRCLNNTEANEWQAMQCYISGKAMGSEEALLKALSLFEQFDARHNIADSYFVLAKLTLRNNNPTAAADYASRAALLLSQLGEGEKAELVRTWRRDFVHAK